MHATPTARVISGVMRYAIAALRSLYAVAQGRDAAQNPEALSASRDQSQVRKQDRIAIPAGRSIRALKPDCAGPLRSLFQQPIAVPLRCCSGTYQTRSFPFSRSARGQSRITIQSSRRLHRLTICRYNIRAIPENPKHPSRIVCDDVASDHCAVAELDSDGVGFHWSDPFGSISRAARSSEHSFIAASMASSASG